MKMNKIIPSHILLIFLLIFLFFSKTLAQTDENRGKISGDFGFSGMYYIPDSLINAVPVEEKVRGNAHLNLLYSHKDFTLGARYEFFLYPLIDFEQIGYKGQGITSFFADYKNHFIRVTAGTFYEQFGSGLTLRAYEERTLGVDNSLLGARIQITPFRGITIKGIWGIERKNFDFDYTKRKDFVRGADVEFSLNELFPIMNDKQFSALIGGSFVSKYENNEHPTLKLPANVGTWAARFHFRYKGFRIESEYAHKINDPNQTNGYIYKNGEALFGTISYSMKGLGTSISFLRADNFDFRSQRDIASITPLLLINYLPAIHHQYTLPLLGNYSFVSQPNGQIGVQFQCNYLIPKKTKIGGKYGTNVSFNYSRFHDIDKKIVPLADSIGVWGTDGYRSSFFKFGPHLLYQDVGIEISRRFDTRWKLSIEYSYLNYNLAILQGHADSSLFRAHHVASDLLCQINHKHALRLEIHHLYSRQDMGSWVHALIEYSISPNWFFSVADAWNYGNRTAAQQIHYFNISATYILKTTRISLQYGKNREGILCSGGVCRSVPASYGVGLFVVTSF